MYIASVFRMLNLMNGIWEHFTTEMTVAIRDQQADSFIQSAVVASSHGSSLLVSMITEVLDASSLIGMEEVRIYMPHN